MENVTIAQLTQANALVIANTWHYPGEYAFYDATADDEDYQELISPTERADHYYQVLHNNELIVFFVVEATDSPTCFEIGLGMAPKMTGQGQGSALVQLILDFVLANFDVNELIMDVASFNLRAQKVYQKLGFTPIRQHQQATNQSFYPFIEMRKTLS